ncbi:MAG: PAS domain-containing protein [Chitinophagales bacterium]
MALLFLLLKYRRLSQDVKQSARAYAQSNHELAEKLNQEQDTFLQKRIVLENDLAQQAKALNQSVQSNQSYEALLNTLNEVVFRLDIDSNFTFLSQQWTTETGWSIEECLGKPSNQFVHIQDRNNTLRIFQSLVKGERFNEKFQVRLKRKNGQYLWVQSLMSISRNKQEDIMGVVGSFVNIHDQKLAELALAQKEEQYRFLSENTNDIITILSLNGIFNYVSPAIEDILGFSPSELHNTSILDILHPNYIDLVVERIQNIAYGETANRYLYECYHKDGSTRWIETIGKGIVDELGAPSTVLLSSRDVSRRIKNERQNRLIQNALIESEAKYRFLSEYGSDIITMYDKDYTYRYVSPAILDILGFSPNEVIGKSPLDFLHPRDQQRFIDESIINIKKGLKKQPMDKMTYAFKHKEEGYRFLESTLKLVVDATGRVHTTLSSSRDVTQRIRLQNQKTNEQQQLEQMRWQTAQSFHAILDKKMVTLNQLIQQNTATLHEVKTQDLASGFLAIQQELSDLYRQTKDFVWMIPDKHNTLNAVLPYLKEMLHSQFPDAVMELNTEKTNLNIALQHGANHHLVALFHDLFKQFTLAQENNATPKITINSLVSEDKKRFQILFHLSPHCFKPITPQQLEQLAQRLSKTGGQLYQETHPNLKIVFEGKTQYS